MSDFNVVPSKNPNDFQVATGNTSQKPATVPQTAPKPETATLLNMRTASWSLRPF